MMLACVYIGADVFSGTYLDPGLNVFNNREGIFISLSSHPLAIGAYCQIFVVPVVSLIDLAFGGIGHSR
jgi:hypothetical protein